MSGYGSKKDVVQVIKATLVQEGRNPRDYYISRIVRDAFTYRGATYGWGAGDADAWRNAVNHHKR